MNEKTKAHCDNCQGDRNHEVLCVEETKWYDDETGLRGEDRYEMLKCGGCDRVILRHTSWFCEDPEPAVRLYPPSAFRREPLWMHEISGKGSRLARTLLREIYVGVRNDTNMIATMGVRALLEHVIVDQVGDQGTFFQNLDKFAQEGFISSKQKDFLAAVLEAGHATIHRAYQPSSDDLQTCIDIAESVLQTVYVHPDKAQGLTSRVPKRTKLGAPRRSSPTKK